MIALQICVCVSVFVFDVVGIFIGVMLNLEI